MIMKNLIKQGLALCLAAVLSAGIGAPALAASTDGMDSDGTTSSLQEAPSAWKDKRADKDSKCPACVNVIEIAASVLGKTEDEVTKLIENGKIGDLLIAEGKLDEFKSAYLAAAKAKLDAAVSDGALTQAEADEKYAKAEEKMSAYDGAEHLCHRGEHSKMPEKKGQAETFFTDGQAA